MMWPKPEKRKRADIQRKSKTEAKTKGRVKKCSKRSLKKKLWELFSKYIRLKSSDSLGFANCVTCGTRHHWKELQAGHFVPGRSNAILFEENGVHPQCARCNYNEGNGPEYFIFMEKNYGRDEIDRLRRLRHTQRKFTEPELFKMIDDFKLKVDGLLVKLEGE